jgi:hypothetical protein
MEQLTACFVMACEDLEELRQSAVGVFTIGSGSSIPSWKTGSTYEPKWKINADIHKEGGTTT